MLANLVAGICLLAGAAVMAAPVHAASNEVERGAYLMNGIVACGNCHTPKGPDGNPLAGQELAGGLVIDAPPFRAVASNLTPDEETGIGRWTDAQIIDAIREGRRPDGSIIGPPMPIEFYRRLSDNDAKALVAYLRTVKPVRNKVEASTYRIPLPDSYGPPVTHVADVPMTDRVAYGRYLSDIGHCMDCHTPMVRGRLDMARVGAGGRELEAFPAGMVVSANLTPANADGVVRWSDAEVKDAVTKGMRPDGRRLVLLMAFDWYRTISPADLDALVAYMRTLPPSQ